MRQEMEAIELIDGLEIERGSKEIEQGGD